MKVFMSIEGGGTHTRGILLDEAGSCLAEAVEGPSNPVDLGLEISLSVLLRLANTLRATQDDIIIDTVTAGIAGAGRSAFGMAMANALRDHIPARRCIVASDIHAALHANAGNGPGILAVAGTGSCVLARDAAGQWMTLGGWGAFFGDEGSAYGIASEALRAITRARDGLAPPTSLESLAEGIEQHPARPMPLALWAARADKREIATLAPRVIELAGQGDAVANTILDAQAEALAARTVTALQRLQLEAATTPLFIMGGVFDHAPLFTRRFTDAIIQRAPGIQPQYAPLRGPSAVWALAQTTVLPSWAHVAEAAFPKTDVAPEQTPSTEARPLLAQTIDTLDAAGIAACMAREDARAAEAVARAQASIAMVIEAAAKALRAGGRLIYVGAGTSGRLGVLDASECPPTFGVSPDRVLGLIAGGERALRSSIEGAEDNKALAQRDVASIDPPINACDLFIGIAASGRTPYVAAALDAAKMAGARTALISCCPDPPVAADTVIVLDTGPEVLAGSTRLKAGTATKMALNQISTGAMALAGFVYDGYMVGVRPMNAKLKRRAEGIVAALTGLPPVEAAALYNEAEHDIRVAVVMHKKGVDAAMARARIERAGGSLRDALEQA